MKYCINCGEELSDKAKFCPNCGTPVESSNNKRTEKYEGSIHKCPNCGEIVKAFQTTCPTCGHEFRDSKSSSALKEFENKLQNIDNVKTTRNDIISTITGKNKHSDKYERKIDLIRSFSIPNNKEDIYEFMILASSNISGVAYEDDDDDAAKDLAEAWTAKFEQAYEKAKIVFDENDIDFKRIQEIYSSKTKKINQAKRKGKVGWILGVAAFVLFYVVVFGGMGLRHSMKEKELNKLVEEIKIDISVGDYDDALIKANQLHMDDGWSDESEDAWDETRENLIIIIKEAKESGR